jgi:tetratricopeptide (TPR) repeat protein
MSKRRKNRPHPPSIKFRTARSGRRRISMLVVATLVLLVAIIFRFGWQPGRTPEPPRAASQSRQVDDSVPAPAPSGPTAAPAAPAVSQPDLAGVVPSLEAPVENPDTNSVSDMINLGNWLLSQDRLEEAEQAYRRAIEINPDDEDAHFNRGIALARQRRFDEAVAEYQKTLEIFPDYVEVRNNLANSLIELGRREEAVKQLELALEINPEYVQALNNLGRIRALNKEWDRPSSCSTAPPPSIPRTLKCPSIWATFTFNAAIRRVPCGPLNRRSSCDPKTC